MEPMKLSDEHKKQIIEMVCRMFSNKVEWEDLSNPLIGERNTYRLIIYNEGRNKRIHWFELCLTYLLDAILLKRYKDLNPRFYAGKEMFVTACITSDTKMHPVDYLYEIFQKVK